MQLQKVTDACGEQLRLVKNKHSNLTNGSKLVCLTCLSSLSVCAWQASAVHHMQHLSFCSCTELVYVQTKDSVYVCFVCQCLGEGAHRLTGMLGGHYPGDPSCLRLLPHHVGMHAWLVHHGVRWQSHSHSIHLQDKPR